MLKQRYVNGETQEIRLDTTPPNSRDAHAAELWVASVGTIAHIAEESLEGVAQQIKFEGWYGFWLHYMLLLFRGSKSRQSLIQVMLHSTL